jgi:hypothetical protein
MHRPIPDSYWVVDGLLLAGEYAGAATPVSARYKLEALLEAGIRAFFDLTEEGELSPYNDMLRDLAATEDYRSPTIGCRSAMWGCRALPIFTGCCRVSRPTWIAAFQPTFTAGAASAEPAL